MGNFDFIAERKNAIPSPPIQPSEMLVYSRLFSPSPLMHNTSSVALLWEAAVFGFCPMTTQKWLYPL
jgi:hypothetical protein